MGRPYMRSRETFSKPQTRAICTACRACSKLWGRPSFCSTSSRSDWTPRDMRLKPSARSFFSRLSETESGLASKVISASLSTRKRCCSSAKMRRRLSAPKKEGVPPPK